MKWSAAAGLRARQRRTARASAWLSVVSVGCGFLSDNYKLVPSTPRDAGQDASVGHGGSAGTGGVAVAGGVGGAGGSGVLGSAGIDASLSAEPGDAACAASGCAGACRSDADCPGEDTDCATPACVDGACVMVFENPGTTCNDDGGQRCDPNGACVDCRVDGNRNDAETDVDCGGPDCEPCPALASCRADEDCEARQCTQGSCFPATCIDGIQNGSEAGVDCGAECPTRCAQGSGCSVGGDCETGFCVDGVCCGTPCSGRCEVCLAPSGACTRVPDGDDPNDACPGPTNVCDGEGRCTECSDSTKNGAETGFDCGGGVCEPCEILEGCVEARDCASCVCSDGLCDAPQCDNGLEDGCETDIDCGGPCGATCGPEQRCASKADCASSSCVDGVCDG